MLTDIVARLRRDADYLLRLHEREHPGQRTSAPWYVETMREAAREIETLRGQTSGSDLCACCGEPVPEGRQVCWRCEQETERKG